MLLTSFFPYCFHVRTVIFSVRTRSKSFFGPFSLFPLPPLDLVLIICYTVLKNQDSIKEFILCALFRKLLAEKAVQLVSLHLDPSLASLYLTTTKASLRLSPL